MLFFKNSEDCVRLSGLSQMLMLYDLGSLFSAEVDCYYIQGPQDLDSLLCRLSFDQFKKYIIYCRSFNHAMVYYIDAGEVYLFDSQQLSDDVFFPKADLCSVFERHLGKEPQALLKQACQPLTQNTGCYTFCFEFIRHLASGVTPSDAAENAALCDVSVREDHYHQLISSQEDKMEAHYLTAVIVRILGLHLFCGSGPRPLTDEFSDQAGRVYPGARYPLEIKKRQLSPSCAIELLRDIHSILLCVLNEGLPPQYQALAMAEIMAKFSANDKKSQMIGAGCFPHHVKEVVQYYLEQSQKQRSIFFSLYHDARAIAEDMSRFIISPSKKYFIAIVASAQDGIQHQYVLVVDKDENVASVYDSNESSNGDTLKKQFLMLLDPFRFEIRLIKTKQSHDWDCGLACIQAILNYFDCGSVSEDVLLSRLAWLDSQAYGTLQTAQAVSCQGPTYMEQSRLLLPPYLMQSGLYEARLAACRPDELIEMRVKTPLERLGIFLNLKDGVPNTVLEKMNAIICHVVPVVESRGEEWTDAQLCDALWDIEAVRNSDVTKEQIVWYCQYVSILIASMARHEQLISDMPVSSEVASSTQGQSYLSLRSQWFDTFFKTLFPDLDEQMVARQRTRYLQCEVGQYVFLLLSELYKKNKAFSVALMRSPRLDFYEQILSLLRNAEEFLFGVLSESFEYRVLQRLLLNVEFTQDLSVIYLSALYNGLSMAAMSCNYLCFSELFKLGYAQYLSGEDVTPSGSLIEPSAQEINPVQEQFFSDFIQLSEPLQQKIIDAIMTLLLDFCRIPIDIPLDVVRCFEGVFFYFYLHFSKTNMFRYFERFRPQKKDLSEEGDPWDDDPLSKLLFNRLRGFSRAQAALLELAMGQEKFRTHILSGDRSLILRYIGSLGHDDLRRQLWEKVASRFPHSFSVQKYIFCLLSYSDEAIQCCLAHPLLALDLGQLHRDSILLVVNLLQSYLLNYAACSIGGQQRGYLHDLVSPEFVSELHSVDPEYYLSHFDRVSGGLAYPFGNYGKLLDQFYHHFLSYSFSVDQTVEVMSLAEKGIFGNNGEDICVWEPCTTAFSSRQSLRKAKLAITSVLVTLYNEAIAEGNEGYERSVKEFMFFLLPCFCFKGNLLRRSNGWVHSRVVAQNRLFGVSKQVSAILADGLPRKSYQSILSVCN